MRIRNIFLTLLISLALMGLVWVSTVAAASDTEGEIELSGIIQEIGADSLVVDGLTVTVDQTTEIEEGGESLTLADLEVGWTVKVQGFLSADGSILAEEIEVTSREPVTPSPSPSLTPSPTVTPTVTITPTLTPTPTVTPVPEEAHPVGWALAIYFDIFYDEIMGWHEGGIGFGNIAKGYFLADELEDLGLTVEYVFEQKLSGAGWGQIMKALGLSPSSRDKNLGQVMSDHGDDQGSEEALTESDDHPGQGGSPPKGGKDKGKTPPGQNKDKEPPGHAKEKEKGKGHRKP